jgi:HAD superfamily hydrolase (TIGR01484 family)
LAARLIVFDLDGTLLGADNRLSAYTAGVLNQAREAGLTLMAASGRSRWAADLVLENTEAVEYVICSNGAVLYHRPSRKVVRRRTITPGRLTKLYSTVNDAVEGACWAWETDQGVVPDEAFRALGTGPDGTYTLDELSASPRCVLPGDAQLSIDQRLAVFGPTVRGLLAHPHLSCRELVRRLQRHRVPAKLSSSSAIFLEVTAPGIHKAAMLKDFCAREGILSQEVVAFGDHLNDLTMLRWSGRGIAMSNAYRDVREQISEHTDASNDDDGVAIVIEKVLADRQLRANPSQLPAKTWTPQ